MDLDPDIAIPSIEAKGANGFPTGGTTPRSDRVRQSSVSTNWSTTASTLNKSRSTSTHRLESSPIRTSYKTPRSRPSTPGSTTLSRSSSVASLRNERVGTPQLTRKTSVPNLSARNATPAHQPQFRRTSSNLNPATPLRTKAMERAQMTPVSVAKDYFRRDLQKHSRTGSEVVVFTHDSCYGHRFSRPRATKATLASIVERPERIHATLLGASTAYVQLGQRHKDGRHAPHPDVEPSTAPFAIVKSTRSIPLNHPAVTAVHGTKWMDSLQVMCDSAEAKLAMGQKELSRPVGHSKDAKGNTLPALHPGDLYLASESLDALQGCLGGVCDAVDVVFQPEALTQRAFVCIRPPGHHCSADMPSGFCWLNNVHVGISYAAMNYGLTHAVIIDFDLHHGDGSQTITWDHNREAHNAANPKSLLPHRKLPIGYYSLHDINSYPCEYGDEDKIRNASTCIHSAHGQSIWNVHLESWSSLSDFWRLYEAKYKILLDKAEAFLESHSRDLQQAGIEPKGAVFLSSGFDASEWEGEGMQRHGVNVPTDFYAKITSDVVDMVNRPLTGAGGRVISVLEGGYSDRALTSGVLSHMCGLTQKIATTPEPYSGLSGVVVEEPDPELTYDSEWWHVNNLELLEEMVLGNLPKPPPKPKDKTSSTFSSPTQASQARMTDIAKERKSLSAQLEARLMLENAPLEPAPEVDWVTAAYELSRLLIPDNRQTRSCTHEELNAENSRARRDRLSLTNIPTSDGPDEKMQLRDRKPRQLATAASKVASRTSTRRTTIAAASDLPDATERTQSRTRRRSSAASTVVSAFNDLALENKSHPIAGRVSSRAPSVVSSRPDSAVGSKKVRAPAKKPISSGGSPRKTIATASLATRPSAVKEENVEVLAGDAASTSQSASGMDELTAGMKNIRIKLNMPTKEEHVANRKRAEESRLPVQPAKPRATTTRKPVATKAVKPKLNNGVNSAKAEVIKPGIPKTSASSEVLSQMASTYNANQVVSDAPGGADHLPTPPAPVPVSAQVQTGATRKTATHTMEESAVQPRWADETFGQTPALQQAGLAQPDADVSYPSVHLSMASVSPPPASNHQQPNQTMSQEHSVWDIPETPRP